MEQANRVNELFRFAFASALQDENVKEAGQCEPYELAERIYLEYAKGGKVTMMERAKKLDEEVHELAIEGRLLDMAVKNTWNAMQAHTLPLEQVETMKADETAIAIRYMNELADVISIALSEVSRISHATGTPFGVIERKICGMNAFKHEQRQAGNKDYGHTSPVDDLPF